MNLLLLLCFLLLSHAGSRDEPVMSEELNWQLVPSDPRRENKYRNVWGSDPLSW